MAEFLKGKGKKNEGEGRAEQGIEDLREVRGHVIKEVNLTTNEEVSRKGTVHVYQTVIAEGLPDHKIPNCTLTNQQKHTSIARQCTTDKAQFLRIHSSP